MSYLKRFLAKLFQARRASQELSAHLHWILGSWQLPAGDNVRWEQKDKNP